jgi:hypothetical protein
MRERRLCVRNRERVTVTGRVDLRELRILKDY